ncbi:MULTISPECIES: alpha/beta hydrolase [unclassified Arthrobacter]|uniref:alpha/beta hydrolase n=1 Tax=unclassified Arthrobacter TaxID=235627 RepID=UPI0021052F37|nr:MULTISPECIES: alpha/beta hydrolase [unclassified Arthrobacter]MCQ1987610.1 alpha/beta hydrolase [Arthrobacter sp. zg-Y844]MCQ1996429.1 alpha/beta hydrolase [Arthrobacter sp. zg-Y1171]UWX82533.1 alpha/beta hydrolase [Arthrobacter sp. zg-Y1171]
MKLSSLTAAGLLAGAVAAAGISAAAVLQRGPRPAALLIRGVFAGAGKVPVKKVLPHIPRFTVTRHRDLRYLGSAGKPSLDLFLPDDPARKPLPVVMWIHGGAWISGSKEDVAPYLKVLAGYGYAVLGVGYSISPEAVYPTAVKELNTALGFIRERADRYGLDPDRIVLAGDSAGAQLAAQLALVITNPEYARDTGVIPAAGPGQLCGIVLNCGVFDLESVARMAGPVGWGLRKALWAYTGSRNWAATPAADHMCIPKHVDHRFPPTYISGGNGDNLTREQSMPLADRLQDLGVPVRRRFWPKEYKPRLGHEYQFQLHRPEAMESLHSTVAFLADVTGVSALPGQPPQKVISRGKDLLEDLSRTKGLLAA